jgi:hypothetical protein
VQKIGKYDPQRCYRFPTGCGRAARVDLFRRVGGCRVDVVNGKRACDVAVTAEDPTVDGLRLSIDVAMPESQMPDAKMPESPKKAQVANSYLELHGIEELLHEAVTSLLREQPEDPRKFLWERFAPPEPRKPEVMSKMPSVASWHMPLPKHKAANHEVYVKPNDESIPKTPFKHLPSAGSWVQKKPQISWKENFNEHRDMPKETPAKSAQESYDDARKLHELVQLNAIRTQAQTTLASAQSFGKVGHAMSKVKDEYIKKKMNTALLQSAKSGNLSNLLVENTTTEPDGTIKQDDESPQQAIDEETVSNKVQEQLSKGLKSGDLEKLLTLANKDPELLKETIAQVKASRNGAPLPPPKAGISFTGAMIAAMDKAGSSLTSAIIEAMDTAIQYADMRPPTDLVEKNLAAQAKKQTKDAKVKAQEHILKGLDDGNLSDAVKKVKIARALGNL